MDGAFIACPPQYAGGQLYTVHAFEEDKLPPLVYCLITTKSCNFYITLLCWSLFLGSQHSATRSSTPMPRSQSQNNSVWHRKWTNPSDPTIFPTSPTPWVPLPFLPVDIWQRPKVGVDFCIWNATWRSCPGYTAHGPRLSTSCNCAPDRRNSGTAGQRHTPAVVPILPPRVAYRKNHPCCGICTNNDCEGWHVRFSNALGKHHPNIWKFLEYLPEEQASLEVMHQQIRGGR